MAIFLVLLSFTDRDTRNVKGTTKQAVATHELARAAGIDMKMICWMLGQYDLAVICEGPDDAAMAAFGLALATAGNVYSQALRVFSVDEMGGILSKML